MSRPLRIRTFYCSYITIPVRDQLNSSPCRTSVLKIFRNALYAIHSFRCWRCVALHFCRPNVIICLYLYISGCIYISLAVFIYLRLYLYISGCTYISPAVLIYLWLYIYISGCIDISPAVLIYLRLYLYISGCIYISPVLHNFDTNGARGF